MSDSKPGDSVEGKIAPQKRVRSKARYTRRKETYPRVKPKNEFRLSPTFYADVLEFAHRDLELFRHNCKYIAYVKRIPFTHLMRELNGLGIRISRETIVGKSVKKHTFPKSLLLSTFALALGVPTWLLLSDNIEVDSQRLKVF